MARAQATDSSVDRTVAPRVLISLIKEMDHEDAKIRSIAGGMGERIKDAVENKHLHRKAFRMVKTLYKMDELKRNDFLRQFALYVEICTVGGLFGAEHVDDLVERAEAGTEGAPDAISIGEAAVAATGIGQGKRRGRPKKGALDGAEAESGTRIQ